MDLHIREYVTEHINLTQVIWVLLVPCLCEKGQQVFQENTVSSWDSGLYVQVLSTRE